MNTSISDRILRRAAQLLDHPVHLVLDDNEAAIRAWLRDDDGPRWVTASEWKVLFRHGLVGHKAMQPAPERGDHEDACPCPGCGRCACPWIGDGRKPCSSKRCRCPRTRQPVRLGLRRASFCRVVLEVRRGEQVLTCLGEYTRLKGWDFSRAGDAKAHSLPAIIGALLAREERRLGGDDEVRADFDEVQAGFCEMQASFYEPEGDDLEVPPPLAGFDGSGVE